MLKKIFNITFLICLFQVPSFAQTDQPPVYKVTSLSFNLGTFSEISPVLVENGIIFCSDRRFSAIMDRTSFEGQRLYNFYIAERRDSNEWDKPRELKSERSALFNNGPLCIAPDGRTVYFTSEIETGKATRKRNHKNFSGIFIADLEGDNLVSLRPFPYNNGKYNIGQPSLSRDGKYLFFSSTMPGGQGGSDIYYCEFINGQWSPPVNIGPEVNSSSAENYPFMHPSGRLYFSSDRPGGMGQLDVYYTSLNMGRWEEPALLPEPVNSAADDFAFVAEETLQTGYFSSNRRRSDDIYQFASTIIRKASCDTLVENNYCYQMIEENAVKYDTLPFRYEWNFGDGNRASGSKVIHCYAGPGTYLVQLDVVNLITREVMYNQKTYNLAVQDVEQPYISGPDNAEVYTLLTLNAGSTNLPGWNITKYYWNFGDETIAIGREVDKVFTSPGNYNIQLIVTDDTDPGGMIRETCVCKNILITRQP